MSSAPKEDAVKPGNFLMAHRRVGALALQHLAVAVEETGLGGRVRGLHLGEAGQSRRRQRAAPGQQHHQQRPASHLASTFMGALGSSPNVSGAYIASMRVGGSANVPTLLSRTVYSVLKRPAGRWS